MSTIMPLDTQFEDLFNQKLRNGQVKWLDMPVRCKPTMARDQDQKRI